MEKKSYCIFTVRNKITDIFKPAYYSSAVSFICNSQEYKGPLDSLNKIWTKFYRFELVNLRNGFQHYIVWPNFLDFTFVWQRKRFLSCNYAFSKGFPFIWLMLLAITKMKYNTYNSIWIFFKEGEESSLVPHSK